VTLYKSVVTMQTTDAINLLETVLRDLIREVIGASDWQSTPKLDLERIEANFNSEAARRRGARIPTNMLDYADFDALRWIVDARWERFKPILQNQKHCNA
jgi:hypothetical protein